MYNFPESWKNNLRSVSELHDLLDTPHYLPDIAQVIDQHYVKQDQDGRPICIPSPELKSVQRKIYKHLLSFEQPDCVHGGVKGRSIISNASVHTENKWVYCVDIVSFFPSSHHTKIYHIFIDLGCSHSVARLLHKLTTFNYELPQGAPTSPVLANLVLYNFDKRVQGLCKKTGLNYTRYFDDLALSGRQNPEKFSEILHQIANDNGYCIHKEEKVKLMHKSETQKVTGLIVNSRSLEVPQDFYQNIVSSINEIRDGEFPESYYENPEKYKRSIEGKILFLHSAEPEKAAQERVRLKEVIWPHLKINF